MKTLKIASLFILLSLFFSGCGISTALVGNVNGNLTNVELSRKNFKVIDRISGTSSTSYILGIGGISAKALVEKAKADMLSKQDLTGGSRAIVNVTVEEHISSWFIFYMVRTVTVSAHLIEFTD